MFPYRDENETVRTPVVTIAIIAANALMWLVVQGAGTEPRLTASVCGLGLVPGELTQMAVSASVKMARSLPCDLQEGRQPLTVLTSMFLHGSWMHLLGNMWFFWIFGNNVEDSMGRARFVAFYLLCGAAAAAAQVASSPGSVIPMVGASGAIGGVMGAYVVLYPKVKVYNMVFLGFFLTTVALPAWVMLGYWMLIQVVGGLGAGEGGGVAFWAHVGGFLAGLMLIKAFARSDYVAEHAARHWRPRHLGLRRSEWQ